MNAQIDPAGEIITAEMLPFVRIDDVIIYLHRYDGFKISEQFYDGEWEYTLIEAKRGDEWDTLGLVYGKSEYNGNYFKNTAMKKAQAAIDAIETALEKWNERGAP